MSDESQRKFLYRLLFKLKVHESYGDKFQHLFNQVMELSHDGFQSIAPWGNWGDGGNDGWICEEGHYYQVYGPKPHSKASPAVTTAVVKAIEDFAKLPEKWSNVQNYTFVFNDYFNGAPAPIASALDELKTEHNLDSARVMTPRDLMKLFMDLEDDEKQEILGTFIPEYDIGYIDTRAVSELLRFLANTPGGGLSLLGQTAPDFEEKIVVNGLSPRIGSRLTANSYHVSSVNEFLEYESGLDQAISNEINRYYVESTEAIPDHEEDAPDLRYLWMVSKIIEDLKVNHPHSTTSYETAAEIVIAKYFESCDAYEHPDTITTA